MKTVWIVLYWASVGAEDMTLWRVYTSKEKAEAAAKKAFTSSRSYVVEEWELE
jgi:hypothetical protein